MKKTSWLQKMATAQLLVGLLCPARQLGASQQPPSGSEQPAVQYELPAFHPEVSGFFSVSLRTKGRSESFDAVILAQSPDKLFVQILDDLAQEQMRLVADGVNVLYYDAVSDHAEWLPQKKESLKKILRLPLSVEDFIQRMTLLIPEDASVVSLEEVGSDCIWPPFPVFRMQRKNEHFEAQGHPTRLTAYETGPKIKKGKWKYRVSYQNYMQEANRAAYPAAIEWTFKKPKLEISMRTKKIEFKIPSPQTRFDTSLPLRAMERNTP